MKSFGAFILILLAIAGMSWFFTANDYKLTEFFAPKYEQVRRNTFEQSKAYRQGNAQELENMQFQYEQADEDHKAGLKSIILHRAADIDLNSLSPDLRNFIYSLQHNQK